MNQGYTKNFKTKEGGSVMSSLLFNLYMVDI